MTSPDDLTAALEATKIGITNGVSLTKQARAGRQLRSLHAAWQSAELEASKHRHIAAPNAERMRVRAMEAFAECCAIALNLSEDQ